MVYANDPYDKRLKTLTGFSAVKDAPREEYSLYAVDLQELDRPTQGSTRPHDSAARGYGQPCSLIALN
jgi:hypothetical protein